MSIIRLLLVLYAMTLATADRAIADSLISGLELSEMTPALRTQYAIPEPVHGVVVVAVDPNGLYAEKGLHAGQLINAVGQTPTLTPQDVAAAMAEQIGLGRQGVLLQITEPSGEQRFIALPADRIEIPSLIQNDWLTLRETWPIPVIIKTLQPYLQSFEDFKAKNPWLKSVLQQGIAALLIACMGLTLVLGPLVIHRRMPTLWHSLFSSWKSVRVVAGPANAGARALLRQQGAPNPAAALEALRLAHAFLEEVATDNIPDPARTREFVNTVSIAGRHIALAEAYGPSVRLLIGQDGQPPWSVSCNDAKVRALYLEGLARYLTQPRRGIRALKRAIAIDPSHAQVRYLLGTIYTRLLDRRHAKATLRQAVMLDPDNMAYRMQLGRAEVISILEIAFDRLVKTITVLVATVSWSIYLFMVALYLGLAFFLFLVLVVGQRSPETFIPLVAIWGLLVLINFIPVGLERLQLWLKKQSWF